MSKFVLPKNILLFLQGITFPITTDDLVDYAKDRGAGEEVLAQLRFAPGHIFKGLDDINLTYGLFWDFAKPDYLDEMALTDDMIAPEESALTVRKGAAL